MTVDTHAVDVDIVITSRQLLNSSLLIRQTVVTQVAVTVVVIPLRAVGVTTTVTYRNHDETSLCQAVGTNAHTGVWVVCRLHLRAWIYIINDWIVLCRVKVKWLVHHTIEIGNTISRLHGKGFWELVAVSQKLREVALLECHQTVAQAIVECCHRDSIHA